VVLSLRALFASETNIHALACQVETPLGESHDTLEITSDCLVLVSIRRAACQGVFGYTEISGRQPNSRGNRRRVNKAHDS
jgi:hypothetical protein